MVGSFEVCLDLSPNSETNGQDAIFSAFPGRGQRRWSEERLKSVDSVRLKCTSQAADLLFVSAVTRWYKVLS